MGTVTQYNLANVQAALGGANPISMSEYYRGGAYVPTMRNNVVREPTSGEYYSGASGANGYAYSGNYRWDAGYENNGLGVRWAGTQVYGPLSIANPNSYTSVTAGGYTYYRGSFGAFVGDGYTGIYYTYAVYRTSGSTVAINTGVPISGAISLSQLYGAENP